MELKNFTFLFILIILFISPFVLTFTGRYDFRYKIRYAMPALFISGFIFLLWDIKFTTVGIWSYNKDFTIGIFQKGLPLEDWLFYLIFPFTAIFVYEVLKSRISNVGNNNIWMAVSLVLIVGFALVAYFYRIRIYTFFVFLFSTIYLAYTIFRKQFKQHLTHFYLSYLLMLVPYGIFSWMLTWNMAVEYHQEQVLGIWIGLMPIENLVYLFLLMLINITVYEYLSERKFF